MKRTLALLSFLILPFLALADCPCGDRPDGTQEIAAQAPAPIPAPKATKYPRGYKQASPEVTAKLHAEAHARNGHRIKALPKATQAAFDCATAPGYVVLPCDDQATCGDCFGVSVADGAASCMAKAGILPATEDGRLSLQCGLDCGGFDGGCNGGDEAQVFEYLRTTGLPLQKDYGPYRASPGRCKDLSGMKIYKISNWGYCTPSQESGVANTQDIKNCMIQYGRISVAFDASECDGYNGGTMTGRGRGVDHAVLNDGWDDNHDNGDGTKGAWIGQNQWSKLWGITINGIPGRFWIAYGADSFGYEAIWCSASSTPPPTPPGPTPPVPPGPVPPPIPPVPSYTIIVPGQLIPGQVVTVPLGLGRSTTIRTAPVQLPNQTVTFPK